MAMCSTKPSSTALPASIRSVQWSWPAGTGLHAIAIRWACCAPVSAAERRAALLLAPVVQHRIQTADEIPGTQVGDRVGADAICLGKLGGAPAGVQLEQDLHPLQRADVDFASMVTVQPDVPCRCSVET
jgi:hypothetical protein